MDSIPSRLESFLVSLASRFVDRVACFVIDDVAAHRARHTDVGATASDSSK